MRNVHLTNCVHNVDDKKGTPAEKKDSHNDAHLIGDDEDNAMTPHDDDGDGDHDNHDSNRNGRFVLLHKAVRELGEGGFTCTYS